MSGLPRHDGRRAGACRTNRKDADYVQKIQYNGGLFLRYNVHILGL
jgi:hypothetical protein